MLPDGWVEKSLGEIIDVQRGISWSADQETTSDDPSAQPVLSIPNIKQKLVANDLRYLKREAVKPSSNQVAKKNWLLMIGSNGNPDRVGNCVQIKDENSYLFASFLLGIYPSDPTKVSPDFLFWLISSYKIQHAITDSIQGSTGLRNISLKMLRSENVSLPPFPEQERIAEVLGSVEAAIDATAALIKQAKTVKQGLLKNLLSRGIGHTKFKESQFGKIPETWEVMPFGSLVGGMVGGVSVNSQDRPHGVGEIGILKTSAVSGGIFYPEKHKAVLPEERDRAKINPIKGSIIFSRMNTPDLVGQNAYVEADFPDLYLPDRLWLITVADPTIVSPRWLSQMMASDAFGKTLSEIATGTSGSMKNISKAKLNALLVAVPPIVEQVKIAEIILGISNHIARETTKLATLQTLKTGLMDDLLTGKVRTVSAQSSTTSNVVAFIAKPTPNSSPAFTLMPTLEESYLDALLAAEINAQLNGTHTFGSVKLEKILDITVRALGFDEKIDRTAYRHAAGPYDSKARYKREETFKKEGWFSVIKIADEAVRYPPASKVSAYKADFENYFGYARNEINRIIDLFRNRDTDQSEIAATVYAVWNDFLIDKKTFDDDALIHEFRYNWHPSKQRFTQQQVREGIHWLRSNKLIPQGNGRRTKFLKAVVG